MRITSEGQVTIPGQVRRVLGLEPGDDVEIVVEGDRAVIVPASRPTGRGDRVVAALLGCGDVELSTDEIMALTRGPVVINQIVCGEVSVLTMRLLTRYRTYSPTLTLVAPADLPG